MSSKNDGNVRMTILSNIRTLSHDELTELYGIEILSGRGVFDPVKNITYANLKEWAEALIKEEQEAEFGTFEKRGSRSKFDDEY